MAGMNVTRLECAHGISSTCSCGAEDQPAVIRGDSTVKGIPLVILMKTLEKETCDLSPGKTQFERKTCCCISGNFATVKGESCIIVDDVITSREYHEGEILRKHGKTPTAILVIFDKRGISDIDEVPVYQNVQTLAYRLTGEHIEFLYRITYIEVQFHFLPH